MRFESESAEGFFVTGRGSGERFPVPVAEIRDVENQHTSPCQKRPDKPLSGKITDKIIAELEAGRVP